MAVTPMRSTTHLAQGLALGDVEQEDLRQAGLVLQESVLKGRRRERAATKEGAGVARQPTHHSPRRQLGEGGVGGGEDGEVARLQRVGQACGKGEVPRCGVSEGQTVSRATAAGARRRASQQALPGAHARGVAPRTRDWDAREAAAREVLAPQVPPTCGALLFCPSPPRKDAPAAVSAATRVLKFPAATAVSTMLDAARTRTAPRGAAAQRRGTAAVRDLDGARSCWVIIRADMGAGGGGEVGERIWRGGAVWRQAKTFGGKCTH